MPLHFKAWCHGFKLANAPFQFDKVIFQELAGLNEEAVVNHLNQKYSTNIDASFVAKEKGLYFTQFLSEIEVIEPVTDYLNKIATTTKVTVVSGSDRNLVNKLLQATELTSYFNEIITPEDVAPERGKPHPDMFLLAAKRLQVDPKDCLVIEDGQSGIDGANQAGMDSVLIPASV